MLEFVRRVHIEYEQPVRIQVVVDMPECAPQLAVSRQVVETVKTAYSRVDRAVQLEVGDILPYQQDVVTKITLCGRVESVPRLGEHILGQVDADKVVAAAGKLDCQAAGTAREVEQRHRLFGHEAELTLDVVGNRGIVDLRVQPVIYGGERRVYFAGGIPAHLRSSRSSTVI